MPFIEKRPAIYINLFIRYLRFYSPLLPEAKEPFTKEKLKGSNINSRWLVCFMGVPPPQGSPAAAPIASSSFQGGLWLDGSIIIPAAILAKQSAIDCFTVR